MAEAGLSRRTRRGRCARAVALLVGPAVVSAGLVVVAPPAAAAEVYTVPQNGVFTVDGRGYGHGRGMSQWGAQGGASLGRSSAQILDAYYPGTVSSLWGEDSARPLRVVLTRLGEEGRRPAGSPATDRRYECDSTGAAACDLVVLAAGGLTLSDGGRPAELLTTDVAVPGGSARVERWGVYVENDRLHVRAFAGGSWQYQGSNAGPLVFGGPSTLSMAYLDGSVREYRGRLSAVRTSATTLARVNLVPREEYLRSVVPKEASPSWQPAALQAQSVAARSYADSYRAARPADAVWDICDSTFCQVYAGRSATPRGAGTTIQEAGTTDAAIAATQNLVRTSSGRAIRAEFSASNGGWSVDGGVSWLPARADPWDGVIGNPPNSSNRWTGSLPASALEAAFPVGRLTSIVVRSRDGRGEWGGRVGDVELRGVGTNGVATSVPTTGEAVRLAYAFSSARPGGLRSSWWTLRPVPNGELSGSWSRSAGNADLAWRRLDGQVGVGSWSPTGGMSSEVTLGGAVQGGPTLADRRSGPLEVFARGTDDQLWAISRSGETWGPWQGLGGALRGRPAVTRFLDEQLHVFVQGSDGALWHRWSTAPSQWSAWERLGGALAPGSGPAAVSTAPGRLDVVVQGTDRQAWRLSYAGGWGVWQPLGGRIQGDPAVASSAGELSVVVLGDDRIPWTTTITPAGQLAPWTSLGGQLTASPTAAPTAGGRLDVFGTGNDGGFHVTTRTAAGWSSWRRIA